MYQYLISHNSHIIVVQLSVCVCCTITAGHKHNTTPHTIIGYRWSKTSLCMCLLPMLSAAGAHHSLSIAISQTKLFIFVCFSFEVILVFTFSSFGACNLVVFLMMQGRCGRADSFKLTVRQSSVMGNDDEPKLWYVLIAIGRRNELHWLCVVSGREMTVPFSRLCRAWNRFRHSPQCARFAPFTHSAKHFASVLIDNYYNLFYAKLLWTANNKTIQHFLRLFFHFLKNRNNTKS